MRAYSFERLEVWQLSRKLTVKIYELTKNFPPSENFGITSQLRRAAISVSSNIAESTSRHSLRDKIRFIEISYGSLMELLSQIIISTDLQFLHQDAISETRPEIEELSNKLNALRSSYTR